MKRFDVIVVGGGLAGLTAALHLAKAGLNIALFEKHPYPRHKVCGEYLSNEIRPYLESLGLNLEKAVAITHFQFSSQKGRFLNATLPLGGMGISRYYLDHQLSILTRKMGVHFVQEAVNGIRRDHSGFVVDSASASLTSDIVIGAHGKRAALDRDLKRPYIKQDSPWLAVKAHYSYHDWPENLVGLHSFNGGYAGISRTETGAVNFCYLASYQSFKGYKNIDAYNKGVVGRNPVLGKFLNEAKILFSEPLTIAQISFGKKEAVYDGILMCGDSAGMIHPLCGNGMAMAIHSAKLAAEQILAHRISKAINARAATEAYRRQWNRNFSARLRAGRSLQKLLLQERLSGLMLGGISRAPWLVRAIISATHGKPVSP